MAGSANGPVVVPGAPAPIQSEIDGAAAAIDAGTPIDERPAPGQAGEMRGVVTSTGAVRATRLRAR